MGHGHGSWAVGSSGSLWGIWKSLGGVLRYLGVPRGDFRVVWGGFRGFGGILGGSWKGGARVLGGPGGLRGALVGAWGVFGALRTP